MGFSKNWEQVALSKGLTVSVSSSPIAESISEKEFMAAVIALAKRNGFMVYHTHNSRRSESGFPDLFLCRGEKAIALELKVGKNNLTVDQANWLDAMRLAGIEAAVMRPENWATIEELLR
jgi:VRR-NUC domain